MSKPVVEVDTTIAADPKAVWAAMTARQSAMFPGTTVETDWKTGHPITFSGEWKGKPFRDRGEIQHVEEAKELSFTHWSELSGEPDRPENYHIVRYRLEPRARRPGSRWPSSTGAATARSTRRPGPSSRRTGR